MAKKILVIDDEQLIAKSLQKLLTYKGYEVSLIQDSSLALPKVKEIDFDLIISDVRMPGMDGIEMIMQIRSYLKESQKKIIPEIIMTGYADLDRYEKAKELNVSAYIYKPFDNVEFLDAVKNALEKEKVTDE